MSSRRMPRVLSAVLAAAIGWLPALAGPPDPPEPPAAAPSAPVRVVEDSAYLGVRLREETEHAEGGARITDVVEGSPAAAAGLKQDDVIVRFGGEVVRGPLALSEKIQAHAPGDAVAIGVLRDGRELDVEATLTSRFEQLGIEPGYVFAAPDDDDPALYFDAQRWKQQQQELQQRMRELGERLRETSPDTQPLAPSVPQLFMDWNRPKLGVQLVETTPELRRHLGGNADAGVLVSKVLAGTPAERSGVAVGDLIVAVDGHAVASWTELVEALADKTGKTFALEVVRDHERMTIEVSIPDPAADLPTGPRA